MIKIGLTGGIGSGKSVVASLLGVMNIPVYVADNESKLLLNSSSSIYSALTDLLGKDIYCDGEVDRRRLAAAIFDNPDMLRRVNAIVHPEVRRHFLGWVSRQEGNVCAIESAILFESEFDRDVDFTIMVEAPLEMRIKRAVLRDGTSVTEVRNRIKNQWPDEEKIKRADYIIYNDEHHALIPQVSKLILRQNTAQSPLRR
jgi:dephospho-CoA kinase